MNQYMSYVNGKINNEDELKLWNDLSKYCEMDTYAMVLLLDVLHKYTKK